MANDPHFRNVSLLMHGDGADNGTVFTDVVGHAITRGGNAVTKTWTKQFGSASMSFDGSGDRLYAASAPEFDFGTGDFTVEFGVYLINGGHGNAWARMIQIGNNSTSGGLWLACTNLENPTRIFADGWGSGDYFRLVAEGDALANDTWHHVALCRVSGAYSLWVNGQPYGTPQDRSSYVHVQGAVYIGANESAGECLFGHLDEIRITKGLARYTEAFTPPTEPFPDFDVARLAIPQQAAIVRMINPYTLDGRMRPRIPGMAASFRSGLGTITGTITEDTPFARWALSVLDAVTGEKLSQSEASGASYSIQAPKGRPVLVSCAPAIDGVWMPSGRVTPGEIIVARSPGSTPYAYRCSVGGVTGATEPEWGTTPGGTTADGSAVWTCLARLVQPRMQGPLLAA